MLLQLLQRRARGLAVLRLGGLGEIAGDAGEHHQQQQELSIELFTLINHPSRIRRRRSPGPINPAFAVMGRRTECRAFIREWVKRYPKNCSRQSAALRADTCISMSAMANPPAATSAGMSRVKMAAAGDGLPPFFHAGLGFAHFLVRREAMFAEQQLPARLQHPPRASERRDRIGNGAKRIRDQHGVDARRRQRNFLRALGQYLHRQRRACARACAPAPACPPPAPAR